MKTDPRVRYTNQIIHEAFLSLSQEKLASRITVKEICEKAQINRGTFYKHYQDCNDLMEKIEDQALAEFDDMLTAMETEGVEQGLLSVVNALKSRTQLFSIVAMGRPDHSFITKMVGHCFRYMMPRIPISPALGFTESQKNASYAYMVSGSGAVIEYWLRGGMKEDPESIVATIITLGKMMTEGLTSAQGRV